MCSFILFGILFSKDYFNIALLCFKIYSNNEALTPNPRSPLEDYTLHLVDIRDGKLCHTRHFKVDKIYLSHNQGIYIK